MQLTPNHVDYWRRNLRLTTAILAAWFAVTFVVAWFAVPLADFTLFGWPVPFWFAAQGSLLLYVALVGAYAAVMRRRDVEHGVHEGED